MYALLFELCLRSVAPSVAELYSAEREESTFLFFSVFSSYLHHTIGYGQKQHITVILNLY